MSKYRVFLPSRVLIPPLIWKVYHFSSLWSGSSLLGPYGENGPILMCRGQTLVTQQGIPPLLGFFRSVCTFQICFWSLFDLSLPASHSVTWKSYQSDFLVCHYKAFAQDMPSLGSLHPTNGPSWHTFPQTPFWWVLRVFGSHMVHLWIQFLFTIRGEKMDGWKGGWVGGWISKQTNK